jgi:hypothetical protein
MIIILFGQSEIQTKKHDSLPQIVQRKLITQNGRYIPLVSCNDIESVFALDKDTSSDVHAYHKRISDIGFYMHYRYGNVIISAIYPLISTRKYLQSLIDVNKAIWICLSNSDDNEQKVDEAEYWYLNDIEYEFIDTQNKTTEETSSIIQDIISKFDVD